MEEEETYVWRHRPMLSSPPKRRIMRVLEKTSEIVGERAIYELENGTFLYIFFTGRLDNENTGITDIVETESLDEALELIK